MELVQAKKVSKPACSGALKEINKVLNPGYEGKLQGDIAATGAWSKYRQISGFVWIKPLPHKPAGEIPYGKNVADKQILLGLSFCLFICCSRPANYFLVYYSFLPFFLSFVFLSSLYLFLLYITVPFFPLSSLFLIYSYLYLPLYYLFLSLIAERKLSNIVPLP